MSEFDVAPLLRIEERIDGHEGEAIEDRWEFGQALLAQRVGKQLPKGRLAEVAEATKKSESEISARVKFAERYKKTEVSDISETYRSWYEIVHNALYEKDSQLVQQSTENEWYTPAKYIDAARDVLGTIDLDPASSAQANIVVGAKKFYTAEEDGLEKVWKGNVWLNPPYGGLAGEFTERLVDAYETKEITAAILLVNAHCTDTSWFQPLFNYPLCFTDHRIDFNSADREKTSTSTHGSVFTYFGTKPSEYKKSFEQFGAVIRRYE